MDPPATFWQRLRASFFFRLLRVLVFVYLGVLLVLIFFENKLVYLPSRDWTPPPDKVHDVELTLPDGTLLHAWWAPHGEGNSVSEDVILYMHGNAGNLSDRAGLVVQLRETMKLNVLIIDYPGYGKCSGSPSESGCYAAADAWHDWLVRDKKIQPGRIILYGVSLGGGVAVNLASRKEHRALILVKTFTSMPDAAKNIYPFLPVHWLMSNRFDNLAKIGACRHPVFIASSPQDELAPLSQGRKLFDAANEPKEFFELAGGHNAGLPKEYYLALKKFLDAHAPAVKASAAAS